jgi:hypothetical protein
VRERPSRDARASRRGEATRREGFRARRWAPRDARLGRGEDADAGGVRDAPERRTTAARRRAGKATRAGPAVAATTREAAGATPREDARATTRVAGRTMDDTADIVASSSRGAAATGRGRGPSRLPAAGAVSTTRRRATRWRGASALAPPHPSRREPSPLLGAFSSGVGACHVGVRANHGADAQCATISDSGATRTRVRDRRVKWVTNVYVNQLENEVWKSGEIQSRVESRCSVSPHGLGASEWRRLVEWI